MIKQNKNSVLYIYIYINMIGKFNSNDPRDKKKIFKKNLFLEYALET